VTPRERVRQAIADAALHRIDPQAFVAQMEAAMARAACQRMGELLGLLAEDWRVEADRDRLIDDRRD
jgi:hypothetical protein